MTSHALVIHRRRSGWAASAIAAIAATAGLLFAGFDGRSGNALIALLGAIALSARVVARPPGKAVWQHMARPLAAIGGAAAWALLVSTAGARIGAPSLTPDLALSEMLGIAGAVAMLLTGAMIGTSPRAAGRAITALLVAGSTIAAIGVIHALIPDQPLEDSWPAGQGGRFAGTLGNANVAGTCFAAFAVLALDRATGSNAPANPAARALTAASCLLMIGCTVATSSRAAAVTMSLALLALAAVRYPRHRSWLVPAGIVGAVIAGWLLLAAADADVTRRIGRIGDDWAVRWEMWRHCAALATASPWFGYGLGSFPSLNLATLGDARQANALWSVNSPHDLPLQLWLDAGLPYLLLLAAGAVLIARTAWRGGATGPMLAVAVIAADALVDIALDVPGVVALAMLLAGLAWGVGIRLVGQPQRAPPDHERPIGRAIAGELEDGVVRG